LRNSITKIWFVILILVATLGALIYWGAVSYRQSAGAIQRIVQPEQQTELTNSLYKAIVQSDLHFNTFILTRDSLHWIESQRYADLTDSLVTILEGWRASANQPLPEIDTLRAILREKTRINRILLDLKERQTSQYFTEQALDRIKIQLSDSAYIDMAIVEKRDLIEQRDTLRRLDVVRSPEKLKGLSGFFRKLVGRERIRVDTVMTLEEQIGYGLEVSVDSSIVRDYFMDSTLVAVKTILIDVLTEEVNLQRKLFSTELELITYNELLLRNIRTMIGEITEAGQMAQRRRQELAIKGLEVTQQRAFVIAGAGILLGFAFLLLLIRDISRANFFRKNLEAEKERAERLAAAKEIFLSKMSHEIRTPLHSISGLTTLLENETGEGERRKLLNGIKYANQYLSDLIGNMLEQARINSGTFRLDQSHVYIPELCEEIEVLFKHRQEEQGNQFDTHYTSELSKQEVIIDRIKLKQVLINLLGNAFKFTRNGKVSLEIDLVQGFSGNTLLIHVSDTGDGIDPVHQSVIFRPFNQLADNAQPHLAGTGLGLAISKHIVEHFGGELKVNSEKGKGSVFTVAVPVTCRPAEPRVEEEKVAGCEDLFFPLRVLGVEDDEWNVFLLRHFLVPHVHSLHLVHSAADGLSELTEHLESYDLILTDLNLPGMDGRAFFREVRKICNIPVIAMSAGLSQLDYNQLKSIGFADALGKPFGKQDLLDAIGSVFPELHISGSVEIGSQVVTQHSGGFFQGGKTPDNPVFLKFVQSVVGKIRTFNEAVLANDTGQLATLSHQLRSNLEQVEITSLSERLRTIEVFAENGNATRAREEAQDIAPLLEEEIQTLIKEANLPEGNF